MNTVYEQYRGLLGSGFDCECGRHHDVSIKQVCIEKGAIVKLTQILHQLGYRDRMHITADINTFEAAGKLVQSLLYDHGFEVAATIYEDINLVADEAALDRLIMDIGEDTECIIAVGSGTINDLSRYAAFKRGKPYVIVATAPSMDGYASSVSPLIMGGFKNTYTAVAPEAIIGDLDIICHAPTYMVAAGFGDLIGKVICQNDWKLGHILNGEYYCEFISKIIYKAVETCSANIQGLKNRDPEAIEALMHGLVLSGLGMLMTGNSRPASGCEHHLSHFWEMKFLEMGREQVLHGQKVGVASVYMAGIYNIMAGMEKDQVFKLVGNHKGPTGKEIEQRIRRSFGPLSDEVIKENFSGSSDVGSAERIYQNWEYLKEVLENVPASGEIADMLEAVNAPSGPLALGIDRNMLVEGLMNCMYVRNRYTVLRLAAELGVLEELVVKAGGGGGDVSAV